MENDIKYTNTQEETIYVCNQISDKEDNNTIELFFKELIDRRREKGLQASIVIFPEKSAMKVCEENGNAPHMNSLINLVKYLNGDNNYISVEGTSSFTLLKDEQKQLANEGIQIRIIDNMNEIILAIISRAQELSQKQIDTLKKILSICKKQKEDKTYDLVKIGCTIPGIAIEFDDLSGEHYENLLNSINDYLGKSL